jgi:superfamily II DNA or RNA helicase
MSLYDYQSKMLEELQAVIGQGFKRICCVSPTGSGKTIMIREFVRRLENRYKTCFLLPSKVLLDQSIQAYRSIGLQFGRLHGHNHYSEAVANWLTTVQTLILRTSDPAMSFQFFIIDECHHVRSRTYTELMARIFPDAYFIGFTATPVRTDGLGLGAEIDGFKCFQKIIFGPSVGDLIAAKRLSDYTILRPRNPIVDQAAQKALKEHKFDTLEEAVSGGAIIGDMINLFKKHAGNDRGLVFARNINQSQFFQQKYLEAGIKTAHIDGTMNQSQRRSIIKDYEQNRLQVLTSCNTISEGFDVPSCRVVQLARFTQSLSLYCQQKGRGIRYQEGKEKAIIIDHARNFAVHGDMRWITNEDWRSMFYGEDRLRDVNVYECDKCFAALERGKTVCPECGHDHKDEKTGRNQEQIKGFSGVNPAMIDIEFEAVNSELIQRTKKLTPDEAFRLYKNDFMRCSSMMEVKTQLRIHGLQLGLAKLFYDKVLDAKMEVFL